MSVYLIWDRNAKRVLGVYPSSADATTAIRDFKGKVEGRATPKLVLEVLTASDPDIPGAAHDPVK